MLSTAALVVALGVATMVVLDLTSDPARSSTSDSEVFAQNPDRGYSMASTYGDLVWTAGHLPETVPEDADVASQTEAVMEALAATLQETGAGFDTVLMTNVYLTDFEDWGTFNEVYTEYFDGRVPPRVTVQISQLGYGDIEISMVAHVRAESVS